MASPISEFFNDASMDNLLGVDQRRNGKCGEHGDFIDVHYSGTGKMPEGWRSCPECADDAHKQRMQREEQERQVELMRERAERLVSNSAIPRRFISKTFDDYVPETGKAVAAMRKVRSYADTIAGGNHCGQSLVMLGNVGTGKTHLGCSLLADVIRRTGKSGTYWTFSELVRDVKASWKKDSSYTEAQLYNRFARPALVILDEAGLQNFTEFEQTVAYEAINARYLEEKPTVVITNLPAAELSGCLGERAVDRLRENGGRAIEFDWNSHREKGAA